EAAAGPPPDALQREVHAGMIDAQTVLCKAEAGADRKPELANPGAALDRKRQRGKARTEADRLVQRAPGVPGVLEPCRQVDGIGGPGPAQFAEGLVGPSPLACECLPGNSEPGRWAPHDSCAERNRQVDL